VLPARIARGEGGKTLRRKLTPRRATWAALLATPVLVIAAIAVVGVSTAPASKQSPSLSHKASPRKVRKPNAADPARYWTRARMNAAKSITSPLPSGGAPVIAGNTATGAPVAVGGYVPSSLAGSAPAGGTTTTLAQTSTGVLPLDGGLPGPNTTWYWYQKYRAYPQSTVGKLFFTKPGISGQFACTAATTSSGPGQPQNIVWTAGHCLSDGTGTFASWYDNWMFCPSYDSNQGGVNPAVGCWTWSGVTTSAEWFFDGAKTRDYGAILMQSCGTLICQDVGNVTGSLGFAANQARDQHWLMFGYTGTGASNGYLRTTAAEHRFDGTPDTEGPATNSIGTAQTDGLDGGPWMLNFNGGGEQPVLLNSNNSYTISGQVGQEFYGPYFDTQVLNFWACVTANSASC
jgi:hypothetical protein